MGEKKLCNEVWEVKRPPESMRMAELRNVAVDQTWAQQNALTAAACRSRDFLFGQYLFSYLSSSPGPGEDELKSQENKGFGQAV